MKRLVFDSGPLIGLTMNNLLWLLSPLKKRFKGEFCIPESVKSELVDKPFKTKKFKFEALQVQECVSRKILKILPDRAHRKEALDLVSLANSCFSSKGKNLALVHYAEIACLVAARKTGASALVMDERVTREFMENPDNVPAMIGKRLRVSVRMNRAAVKEFTEKTSGVKVIRSVELAAIAFEKGLLDRYIPPPSFSSGVKSVLESVLWGLKLDGCAIKESGIRKLMSATMNYRKIRG